MRPRRDPVPRARDAWVWLGGLFMLGMLGAAVTAAAMALWQNIDLRQLTPALAEAPPPVPLPEPARAGAVSPEGFTAVLFESERNRRYFEDSTFYGRQLVRWREFIDDVGGSVRTATSAAELRSLTEFDVLFLPEAPCLSAGELAEIGAHIQRGGSIVTNWAVGVRDGACAWLGWSTLLDLTGADEIREIPSRSSLFLTVPGGLAISPGLDPGTRVEVRPDPAIALRTSGPRAYWSDWALNPLPDDGRARGDAAMAAVETPQGGRITWYGFRTLQGATPADSVRLDRLFRSGIVWAAGLAHATPSAWPGAARAALVFALDVEGQEAYRNALEAAEMFQAERLPVSFYPVSQLVRRDAELGAALVFAGEVGSQTVDHSPLAGRTVQDQTLRLQRSFDEIEQWTGAPPRGLRPPEEAIDATTLRVWKAAGGRYVLTSNEARSASPEIHATDAGPVVLVPRVLKDDYTVVVRDVKFRSQRLGDAFLSGTRKIRALGGLAVVAGHTQIIVQGPRLDAVRAVADSARAQGDWWLARAEQVADWWLARSLVELRWAPAEPPSQPGLTPAGEHDLLVHTVSEEELRDLWVDVVAPRMSPNAIPTVDGLSVDFVSEPWGMRVEVGTLTPGIERRISFVVVGADIPTRGDG